MNESRRFRGFLVTMLMATGAIWQGCGNEDILTGPSSAGWAADVPCGPEAAPPPGGPWYVVASARVTPGKAATVQGSRYTLHFEKGAVKKATTVSVMEWDPAVLDVKLDPDGLEFTGLVTLAFDYAGTAHDPSSPRYHGGSLHVGRYDEETGRWVPLAGTDDPENLIYTVPLTGFSRYGMQMTIRREEPPRGQTPPIDQAMNER